RHSVRPGDHRAGRCGDHSGNKALGAAGLGDDAADPGRVAGGGGGDIGQGGAGLGRSAVEVVEIPAAVGFAGHGNGTGTGGVDCGSGASADSAVPRDGLDVQYHRGGVGVREGQRTGGVAAVTVNV